MDLFLGSAAEESERASVVFAIATDEGARKPNRHKNVKNAFIICVSFLRTMIIGEILLVIGKNAV
ncbi:hypothetical protein FM107_01530 [Sphingobacterium sp. JB170]|nr:hypothetical protein FM107_01530 [Sphingobacterium sp. JB170]